MSRKPWPRLSETLPDFHHPYMCRACGLRVPDATLPLTAWQEHDQLDHPEPIVVVLCKTCSDALIEKHPRLYRPLREHEPWPGAMPLCVDCVHRDGVRCRHPDLKANGGTGLLLTMPEPSVVMWDGRGKGGRRTGGTFIDYRGPVSACAGRTLPIPMETGH
jgi:hypothetical protein